MTVAVTPTTLSPLNSSGTVLATVASSVPAGVYPVTVVARATANSQITGSAVLTITVTPVVSTTVTQSFCASEAPLWMAYQDGSGAWTRVTPGANNTYTFQLTSARGGIATVDTIDTGFDVNITYATTTELVTYTTAASAGACGGKRLNGTLANVGAGNLANVSVGDATIAVAGTGSQSYQLLNVPDGPQDLVAARVNTTTRRADRLILRRGVNIAAGGAVPVIDFSAPEAFAPASANVTVTGLTTDTAFVATGYDGTRGSATGFLTAILRYTASTGAAPYDAMPGATLIAAEMQQLYAVASTANANRVAGVYFRAPVDRTLVMAPYLSTPAVTRAANTPYARPRVQLDLQSDYNRLLTTTFEQTALNRSAGVTATRAWAGGAAWDVTFPDLSTAAGWNPSWALQSGTPFTWTVAALGGVIGELDTTIADGAAFRSATTNSTTAVP